MPRLAESEFEKKNRLVRAEILKQIELHRMKRKDIAKLWGLCIPTAYKKINNPGLQTVDEMRMLCKTLKIPEEIRGQFL